MNDLFSVSEFVFTILYADDTCVLMNGKQLEDLVTRMDKITWMSHITYVQNKVSKGIGIMFKAGHYLKRNALLNLYHSFIYHYSIYCIEAWGNATNCHLKQLYLIPKKVIRMITFANYNTPCIDIFKNLNILPLDKLVADRIGVMMFKYANDLLPPALNYV